MRRGPDPRPMIKGWLSKIAQKMRELAPEACRALDMPLGVEVDSAGEGSGWIVHLDEGRIDPRSKADQAKVIFYATQQRLQALSLNLRAKYWEEAFQAGNVTMASEDPSLLPKLQELSRILREKA